MKIVDPNMIKPENGNVMLRDEEGLTKKICNCFEKLETKLDKNHEEIMSEIQEGFERIEIDFNDFSSKISKLEEFQLEKPVKTPKFVRFFKWITGINYDKKIQQNEKKFKNAELEIEKLREDIKQLKSKL